MGVSPIQEPTTISSATVRATRPLTSGDKPALRTTVGLNARIRRARSSGKSGAALVGWHPDAAGEPVLEAELVSGEPGPVRIGRARELDAKGGSKLSSRRAIASNSGRR